jgi:hypothetical protein
MNRTHAQQAADQAEYRAKAAVDRAERTAHDLASAFQEAVDRQAQAAVADAAEQPKAWEDATASWHTVLVWVEEAKHRAALAAAATRNANQALKAEQEEEGYSRGDAAEEEAYAEQLDREAAEREQGRIALAQAIAKDICPG